MSSFLAFLIYREIYNCMLSRLVRQPTTFRVLLLQTGIQCRPSSSLQLNRLITRITQNFEQLLLARNVRNGDRLRHAQRLKNQKHEKDKEKSSEESSSSSSEKKDEDDDDKKTQLEKLAKRASRIFAIALFGAGLLFMLSSSRDGGSGVEQITWTTFTEQLLPTRSIREIVVFPEKEIAVIHTWSDAQTNTGEKLKPVYTLRFPSIAKLETEVRAAEAALNMPPEYWIPVKYKRLDEISSMLNLLLIFAIIGTAIYFFRRVKISFNMTDIMGSMMKTKFNIIDPHSVDGKKALKIRFKDVAGCHEAKVEIKEFVDYLRNPSRFTALGAKLPKGALLTGPPGTGKTLLAKALAAESTVPFISMNGTEFVEMIGGLGASRIRALFKEAKKLAPCIIYIDEIDAIGRKRNEGNGNAFSGNAEEEQTLNQLLVEMDGMDSAKGVVVLASTNRPDVLDKALLRRGRFDRHISIDLPTVLERKEMFELYLRRIKTDFGTTRYSGRLAQMTPGFSGADIRNAVNEAAIKAATEQLPRVTKKELEYAMDKIIAGPAKKTKTLVKEEREIVAYHEAGHALVGWLLEHTDALLKVTIIPRTSAALGFAQYSPRDKKLYSKEELFERMCMMLGGRVAENVKFGRITTGAQNDLDKVTKSAIAQVKNYGFSPLIGPLSFAVQDERAASFQEKPYSQKLQATIDQEASLLVGRAYEATDALIKSNIDKLEAIAQNLLKHEVLTYEDVKKLIGAPPFGDKQVIDIVENTLPKEDAS